MSATQLYFGDNLLLPPRLHQQSIRFDLIYMDPPFGVGVVHHARMQPGEARARRGVPAYDDAWCGIDAFLEQLAPRLEAYANLLSPAGSLYVHLDHRTVHETKVLCDRLLGRDAFRGEIIWVPGNGARSRRSWGATHQTILVYTSDGRAQPSKPLWIFNSEDDAMREPFAEGSARQHFRPGSDGRRTRERTVMLKTGPKTYRYDLERGRRLGTVWTDLPAMSANTPLSSETTGYPHQKPEGLLERIVRASSRADSWICDPFCGSGTTLAAALKLGRRAVGVDASPLAVATTEARLARSGFATTVVDLGEQGNEAAPL